LYIFFSNWFDFCRLGIAALHYNENCNKDQATTKDGQPCFNTWYPKMGTHKKVTSVHIAHFCLVNNFTLVFFSLSLLVHFSSSSCLYEFFFWWEHTLLQTLGHHHLHLVSIQSNISSLRTTHFSIHFFNPAYSYFIFWMQTLFLMNVHLVLDYNVPLMCVISFETTRKPK
jgi:hypothetical protein